MNEKIKNKIIEILKAGEYGNNTGIRINTEYPGAEKPVVGEYLPSSYDWNDSEIRGVDESTGVEIDGVCTIAVNVISFLDEVEEDIDEALEKLELYLSRGDCIVLVGGTDSYEGEDPCERIIENGVCLAIFDK